VTKHKGDIDDFFDNSIEKLLLCKQLSSKQSAFWETEAELQGVKNLYYINRDKKTLADDALDKAKQQYKKAIGKSLFTKQPSVAEALGYFKDDTPLRNLWNDDEINQLIVNSVHKP
jgi:hypothetical protein